MGPPFAAGVDDGPVVSPSARTVPLGDGLIGPLRGFIDVAPLAGIGRTYRNIQVGTWHPKTVIRAVIDSHICSARHVTLDTFGTGADVEKHFTF